MSISLKFKQQHEKHDHQSGGKSQVSSQVFYYKMDGEQFTKFTLEFQRPKFDFHNNSSFLLWKEGSPCVAFMVDSEWLNLAVLEVGKVSLAQEGCENFSLPATRMV